MRLNLLLLILVIAATIGATTLLNRPPQPPAPEKPAPLPTQSFPEAPDVSLTALDGKTFQLSDFEGKIVLLNFWASWCVPCAVEFPQLLKLTARDPENVILLAVSVDAEKENISTFFERHKLNIHQKNVRIVWDPGKTIAQDTFQTVRYPETLIIGPDRTLREKIVGASTDFSSDDFYARLMENLDE